jgi:hypothetical protein
MIDDDTRLRRANAAFDDGRTLLREYQDELPLLDHRFDVLEEAIRAANQAIMKVLEAAK